MSEQISLLDSPTRKRIKVHCPTCGARSAEYKHSLSKGLIVGLTKLYEVRTAKLVDLNLTMSQANNMQKLRWFQLIEKGKHGVWSITQRGIDFIEGRISLPQFAWTFRGARVGFDGPLVHLSDITEVSYRQKPDYIADARPGLRT